MDQSKGGKYYQWGYQDEGQKQPWEQGKAGNMIMGNWIPPQPRQITMMVPEQNQWKGEDKGKGQQFGSHNWTQNSPDNSWHKWPQEQWMGQIAGHQQEPGEQMNRTTYHGTVKGPGESNYHQEEKGGKAMVWEPTDRVMEWPQYSKGQEQRQTPQIQQYNPREQDQPTNVR